MGLRTCFGVLDAEGRGAYFETDDYRYARYDLSDAKEGVMVRTNYAYSGPTVGIETRAPTMTSQLGLCTPPRRRRHPRPADSHRQPHPPASFVGTPRRPPLVPSPPAIHPLPTPGAACAAPSTTPAQASTWPPPQPTPSPTKARWCPAAPPWPPSSSSCRGPGRTREYSELGVLEILEDSEPSEAGARAESTTPGAKGAAPAQIAEGDAALYLGNLRLPARGSTVRATLDHIPPPPPRTQRVRRPAAPLRRRHSPPRPHHHPHHRRIPNQHPHTSRVP